MRESTRYVQIFLMVLYIWQEPEMQEAEDALGVRLLCVEADARLAPGRWWAERDGVLHDVLVV